MENIWNMAEKRLIIVSNRLPFSIENEGEQAVMKPASGGLVSAIRGYIESSKQDVQFEKIIWCGNPGCKAKTWKSLTLPTNELYEYLPVFSSSKLYNDFYNGFANSTIWPLFHYFPSYSKFSDQYWEAYQKMNECFFETLENFIQEGDVIWVHDYHLMLLPAMLREKFSQLCIGFFLHIPFPTYELIKFIPNHWQESIIKGLLGADLIGFHTTEYVAHFLETIQGILGVSHQGMLVPYGGRYILVDQFPISIHFEEFNRVYDEPIIKLGRKKLQEYFENQRIIFSIDRLDYTKGISNRINAFEAFLKKYPQYQKQIVFILVIIPSRDKIDKYEERKKMIDESISRVNSSFGSLDWQPIIYRYRSLNFDELLTLYTGAEVALITPIRDGMNLVAKEFVASRADKKGVLILSELAGAAKELQEAVMINPNDIHDLCDKIKFALEIPEAAQSIAMEKMQKRIQKHDIKRWSSGFLNKLNYVHKLQDKLHVKKEDIHQCISQFNSINYKNHLLVYIKSAEELEEILDFYKSIQQELSKNNKIQLHLIVDDKKVTIDKALKSANLIIHPLYINLRPQDHIRLNKSLVQIKHWFEDYMSDEYKIEIKEHKLILNFSSDKLPMMKQLKKSIQKNLDLNQLSCTLQESEWIFESNNQSTKHQLLEYILSLNNTKYLLVGLTKDQIAYLIENTPDFIKLYSIQEDRTSLIEQLKILYQQLIDK